MNRKAELEKLLRDPFENHLCIMFENKMLAYDYIKYNTNLLYQFKEEDIKVIMSDSSNNLYVLLNNGLLYINDNMKYSNIDLIHQSDYLEVFAITKDNKIISLREPEFNDYFGDVNYKKIIPFLFGIVALTDSKEIKMVTCLGGILAGIIPENFTGVEDIKEEDNEIYIFKSNKWQTLFKRFQISSLI